MAFSNSRTTLEAAIVEDGPNAWQETVQILETKNETQ